MDKQEEKPAILGRSQDDIEKYAESGTAYLGKVVLSRGEKPVLGRKIRMDVATPHLILICGKRGTGKCLVGETEIILEDGSLKQIKDLETETKKVLSLSHNYKIETTEKSDFFKRTVDKILEIQLRTGRKIKLTPEHPLLTIDGWKPAQELSNGSRIATPRKLEVFGNDFLRECEIKLLAYLIAEGHIKRRAVWFSNMDKAIGKDFTNAVKDFDEKLMVSPGKKGFFRVSNPNYKREIIKNSRMNGKFDKGIVFNSRNTLRKWLIEMDCYNVDSYTKKIPEKIFKLPKQKISLFLNRLFSCDGTIYFNAKPKSWGASYASASEDLIRGVQHLLLRYEITPILREKENYLNGKNFHSFELELYGENIEKFLKEIGFFGEKEKRQERAIIELTNIKRNPNIDTIPKEIWKYYKPQSWTMAGRAIGYKHPKALRESMRYSPSRQKLLQIAGTENNELIKRLATSDIYWDEIKEIKEIDGSFEVYDIAVPENHNFVANDIIVHNSFSMSVLMEEIARLEPAIKRRLSVIVIDTVGIFWSMKIPNKFIREELFEWDLEPQGTEIKVLVPKGKIDFYKEKKIPVDGIFSIKTSELDAPEWLALFKLTWKDPEGILITKTIEELKEKVGTYFGTEDIIKAVKADTEADKNTKMAVINRIRVAESWGLLDKQGTKITDLAKQGEITVIDVSAYRQAIGMEGTRDIIVALVGKKLFEERMLYRKEEEMKLIEGKRKESSMPIVWLMIDEAHMFMPKDEDNIALHVLLEWVRVGRQPGLSLVLATQRPNKIHPDAISQCDLFISHRMTAQADIEAVSQLRPSYMFQSFDKYFSEMPTGRGYALVIDDKTEKIWMIRVRPRFSWDAGIDASAFTA